MSWLVITDNPGKHVVQIPKRAVVVNNCQCLPIAAWLSTYSAATVFDFWGVHLLTPDQRPALTAEFVARARKEYDLIVSILLSDEFPGMTASEIRGTFDGIP